MEVDRTLDCYEVNFGSGKEAEEAILDEVRKMEENSQWIDDIKTRDLRLSSVTSMEALEKSSKYRLNYDTAIETGLEGTQLIAHRFWNDERVSSWCVRDTARGTLYESAKLKGSALGRMSPEKLAETLNNGLNTSKNKSLVLIRYGKISAVHSDASGGYRIMPISELLRASREAVSDRFGEMLFCGGHNEHKYTSAVWRLPDVQADLLRAYQDALDDAVSQNYPCNFMPALRFYASDTASSAARIIPVFIAGNGWEVRLNDGIAVRHERVAGKEDGVPLFTRRLGELYAMFEESTGKAAELAQIEIWNPENTVVSLCNEFSIPKKWGTFAREEVERFHVNEPSLSAHDVYLAMCGIVGEAKYQGAKLKTVNFLMEAVAKVLNVEDWSEHDADGVVPWKADRKKEVN